MNKFYFVTSYPDEYQESSDKELSGEIEKIGFTYKQGEMGGGGGEIVTQIVANLSINVTPHDIVTGVLSSAIFEVLKTAFAWHTRNKIPNKRVNPSINVYVYVEGNSYSKSYKIDEEHSEVELQEDIVSMINR